jgi:DNA-binding NarL/FixJ family response regulator
LAKGSGTGMTPPQPTDINILVLNETIRQHLLDILKRNQFKPVVIANPGELAAELKERTSRVIFIDYEAETQYGPAMIMNIKAASKEGGIIFLYDKDHRSLIREVMQLGVYGCILAPYDEWAILTMVKHVLAKKTAKTDHCRKKRPANY